MESPWYKLVTVTVGAPLSCPLLLKTRWGRRACRRIKLQSVPWNGAAAVPRGELIKRLAGKASQMTAFLTTLVQLFLPAKSRRSGALVLAGTAWLYVFPGKWRSV